MNMNFYVIFLLGMLMKQKKNLFYKYEHRKIFFSNSKIEFNLESKS